MIHTNTELEAKSPRPTSTVETFNNDLNVSVEILTEDLSQNVYSNDSRDIYDRHCSKLSPDTLCKLTNIQSYVAQEPEYGVRSQSDSVKSSLLFYQSLNFDLQLILSFLVVLTIVHTCKYLLYTSNTPPCFLAKSLGIAHLNINHMMGKIDQVKLILDNELPGIFCLSETFLNDKVDDRLLYHEDLELERSDRIVKAGRGLLCYIQSDITYERRTNLENPTIEIIWLEIKFATSKNILVGFFYCPPNSNSEWLNTFDEDIDLIQGNFNEIILTPPLPISHLCENYLPLPISHLCEFHMCTCINCNVDISLHAWLKIANQNGQ